MLIRLDPSCPLAAADRSEKRRQAMLEDKRKAMMDQFEQEKLAMAKVRLEPQPTVAGRHLV
jgi:hypothetical protein